jgi:hypothetical protein
MKTRQVGWALILMGTMFACKGKYTNILSGKIAEALGPDYDRYQPFSYPTNNFGLATAYASTSDRPKPEDFICDTWECLGKGSNVPASSQELLEVAGFAGVGSNGAKIDLTTKETQDLAIDALLPKVFQVLQLGGSYDKKKITNVTLSLGRAYPRLLRKTRMIPFIAGLPTTEPLRQAFDQGRLVLVVGDVVIDAVKATIDVDQTIGQALKAKLDPGLPSKVFSGVDLGVKVTDELNGKFTFEVTQPVIVKRLTKRQPSAGVLAGTDDWNEWPSVEVALPAPK